MTEATGVVDVKVFFNFRSPYCYIASKTMFQIFDDYHANMVWRPLGGWDGRSPPERAKVKLPLARQDVQRISKRMGIPAVPPPPTTDPTLAGAVSLLAEQRGVLREWIVEAMNAEWAEGLDIGEEQVLFAVGEKVGLEQDALQAAFAAPALVEQMESNWKEAQASGIVGVPTFQVGDEIFWGSDRIDYVLYHLDEMNLKRS